MYLWLLLSIFVRNFSRLSYILSIHYLFFYVYVLQFDLLIYCLSYVFYISSCTPQKTWHIKVIIINIFLFIILNKTPYWQLFRWLRLNLGGKRYGIYDNFLLLELLKILGNCKCAFREFILVYSELITTNALWLVFHLFLNCSDVVTKQTYNGKSKTRFNWC